MTALAQGKQIRPLGSGEYDYAPQKGNTIVFAGGIVMLDSQARALPGAAAVGCIGVGIAETYRDLDRYDATGLADGALTVRWREGIFPMANSAAGDAFATTDQPGIPVFIADDQTVAKTSGGGTRSPAGRLHHVDSDGVWVEMSKVIGAQLSEQAAGAGAGEQIAASGALAPFIRSSILSVVGTKAYTLADGQYAGQRKTIFCRAASATPVGVVTPAHPSNFATLTFGAANESAELEWNGTGWDLVGIGGSVAVA